MSSLSLWSQPDKLMLLAFMIYLAGAATPLMLLRMVADEQSDSCFLKALLWAISLVISGIGVLLLL